VDKRTPNDLSAAVPRFCLALEEFRRTTEGRVRTPQEFMQHFFPHDANKVTDRLFKFLPNEVRGPVLTSWGLRGAKSALKDTDDKVQSVVWDALLAGDIDQDAFEQALLSDVVIRWAPLSDWWSFWRGGKLSKLAIHKGLDSAYELGLFDAKWFFDTIEGPGGKLKGTDVVSEGLTKAELTEWVRKIHASGDGSPKGLLATVGWDRIVGKTPNDVLIRVLDSFAQKVQLAPTPPKAETDPASSDERPSTRMTPVPPAPENAEVTVVNAQAGAPRPRGPFPSSSSVSSPPSPFNAGSLSSAPNAGVASPPNNIVPSLGSPPNITPLSTHPAANPISSLPNEGEIDRLFSESKIPPPEEQEQMIVVEEDIEITGAPIEEGTTSRPPGSEQQPMLLGKPRAPTNPGPGPAPTPVSRGRR
jgi:hypothetical protein